MSGQISRKAFLQAAGLSALAAGVGPASAADGLTGHRGHIAAGAPPKGRPFIQRLDPVMRLYPSEAVQRNGAIRFGPAELDVMLPFFGDGEIIWKVTGAGHGLLPHRSMLLVDTSGNASRDRVRNERDPTS